MNRAVTEESVKNSALIGEATIAQGLEFWPISMRHYAEWERCRNILLTRQAKFPVSCISLPFLGALSHLDLESLEENGKPQGLIYAVLLSLQMALRMDDGSITEKKILPVYQGGTLEGILIRKESGQEIMITPASFDEIRRVIVWQQGDDMPDESLNDELLETEQDLAERAMPPLKCSMYALLSSVAFACGVRPRDTLDWPIIEFDSIRRAIDRSKKHELCALAEINGAKWKGGNPHPSWCFDRREQGSGALIAASEFGKAKKR